MRTFASAALLLLHAAAASAQTLPPPVRAAADRITADQLARDLAFLSSDALLGRNTPSPGFDTAAAYIARRLQAAGLRPLGDDGTFFQHYELREERLDTAAAHVTIGDRRFRFGEDFIIRSFAGPLNGVLPVVFVGHGWTVPAQGIDPYAGLDVRGKLLLVIGGDLPPEGADVQQIGRVTVGGSSPFTEAQRRGAAGIIFLAPESTLNGWDRIRQSNTTRLELHPIVPSAYAALPVTSVHVRPQVREALFDREPLPAALLIGSAAARLRARGHELQKRVMIDLPLASRTVHRPYNVVAMIEGSDPVLRNEYITVESHLDGAVGRAVQNGDSIYNAADDNATGSAGNLSIAEQMMRAPRPKRSLIFIWDSGEERGLWGTRHFVHAPPVPLENIVAHFNIDMIGATRAPGTADSASAEATGPNETYLIGPGVLSPTADALIDSVNRSYLGMTFNRSFDRPDNQFFYPRTDAGPFLERGILTIGFFTGLHPRYHAPSDEARYLDPRKMEAVSRTAFSLIWMLADSPWRPRIENELPPSVPRYGGRAATSPPAQPPAAARGDTIVTATGLRMVFRQRGSGARPARGDVMVIHGIGRFTDGREFWNTRTEQRPYEYRFMTDRVIRGFEEGMRHVRVGDRVDIIMTPDLAYGERGNRDIPPNATLIFDYEILELRPAPRPQPLSATDVGDIATLLMLEDRREVDVAELTRLLRARHPEVRRRAAQAVGRINRPEGRALLAAVRNDADTAVAATVVFSTGQLRDSAAVPWLSSLLNASGTAPTVAREAARSLGKIRSPEARAALARYLAAAPAAASTSPVVGEALLAIGRFTSRGDVAPIVRWTTSPDVQVRWRAAWALFRPRDPAAVPHLLPLTRDSSAEVRFWALRGLAPALADTAGIPRAQTAALLREALGDADRRVRTEALRMLVAYDDDASLRAVLAALDSDDSWLFVSAVDSLGRFADRADLVAPRLIAASAEGRPLSLRLAALTPLSRIAPAAAIDLAASLAREPSIMVRSTAVTALRRLGEAGEARLEAINATIQPPLLPGVAPPPPQPRPPARTLADYRAIVERWVVPDYNGAPRPRALWDTPRGQVEIELYPGDAPLATEYFVYAVESGDIVGTEFGRVVPNFVAQQRPISNARQLRDEVSRLGLTRGNLSWASSGLDTGRPGYTLGSTPQPHNEGDFTALGRIVRGMEVVDRLELGDRVTATRMIR